MKFKVLLAVIIICLAFSKLKRSSTRRGPSSMLNPRYDKDNKIEEYVLYTEDNFAGLNQKIKEIEGLENTLDVLPILKILGSQTIYMYEHKSGTKVQRKFAEIKKFEMYNGSWKIKDNQLNEYYSKNKSSVIVLQNAFMLVATRHYILWFIYSLANRQIPRYLYVDYDKFHSKINLLKNNPFESEEELNNLGKVIALSESLNSKDMQCMPFFSFFRY
jgi:hypothetical protein